MKKNKNLISLIVAGAFFFLSISGILMWLKQKSHEIEMTHDFWFAVSFYCGISHFQ